MTIVSTAFSKKLVKASGKQVFDDIELMRIPIKITTDSDKNPVRF